MKQRPFDYITMAVFINEFDERHRQIERAKKLKIEQKRNEKSKKDLIRTNNSALEESSRFSSKI